MMKRLILLGLLWSGPLMAGDFTIARFNGLGGMQLANSFTNGVVVIESAPILKNAGADWTALMNLFPTDPAVSAQVPVTGPSGFYRARAIDLSGGPAGFSNLVRCYGMLIPIAGAGGSSANNYNKWQPSFEDDWATNSLLSRPHSALGDDAGNIYIVDKFGYGIRKVRPDGIIETVAGTSQPGDGPDDPTPATEVALNQPNGLWVRGDGVVYVLDTGNAKVRRLGTDGLMNTLFTVPDGITGGRGLWVSDDESEVYFSSYDTLKRWTPDDDTVVDFATDFAYLGNIIPDRQGRMLVTDYGANLVYRLSPDGQSREVIAGNGLAYGTVTNGMPATNAPLAQVRGVWCMPTGALLLAGESGSQIWYMDTQGLIYVLVNGAYGGYHSGDNDWFYRDPDSPKVSSVRSVTMDPLGNILFVENDAGYVRMIRFLPPTP